MTRVEVSWVVAADVHLARAESRRLVDRIASERLGRAVVVGRRCPRCGATDHGRPWVGDAPGLGLSVARTAGHVVVATVLDAAVGIDVERLDTAVDRLEDVALGPYDARPVDAAGLLRTWVRKEAVLKAAGVGLLVDPSHLGVTAPDEAPDVVAWTSGSTADPRPVRLVDLGAAHDLPDGLVASLAVTGTSRGPVEVVPATSAAG